VAANGVAVDDASAIQQMGVLNTGMAIYKTHYITAVNKCCHEKKQI